MIKAEHRAEAKSIGDNSFELLNFMQLPESATPMEQIAALCADQNWQENHNNAISRQIDYLINELWEEVGPDHDEQTDKEKT